MEQKKPEKGKFHGIFQPKFLNMKSGDPNCRCSENQIHLKNRLFYGQFLNCQTIPKVGLALQWQRANKGTTKSFMFVVVLYLSGLNMMEGILTKNNWHRFPPKPKEAKLKIAGEDFTWILTSRSWSNQSLYSICNCAIIFTIVLTSE